MAGAHGPECNVDRCHLAGVVDAILAVRQVDTGPLRTSPLVLAVPIEQAESLRLCVEHAGRLGHVYDSAVDIDPELAAGWRIVVEVRPSGRHAIVMYPPPPFDDVRLRDVTCSKSSATISTQPCLYIADHDGPCSFEETF